MTSAAIPALIDALALFKAPRSARPGIDQRLPEGMLHLLRTVAGEEEAIAIGRGLTGQSADALREAAGFYIQQVMFGPGSNSYRVLGVDPDASGDRIREHFRWLARWLHPDRNPDEWENVYVDRVNQAWQHLRTPERRHGYDQSIKKGRGTLDAIPRPPAKVLRQAQFVEEAVPTIDLRWLPKAVFAGLGLCAISTVAIFYVLRSADQSPAPVMEAPPLTAVRAEAPIEAYGYSGATSPVPDTAPAEIAKATAASPTLPERFELPLVVEPQFDQSQDSDALVAAPAKPSLPAVPERTVPVAPPAARKVRSEPLAVATVDAPRTSSAISDPVEVTTTVAAVDPSGESRLAKLAVPETSRNFTEFTDANRILGSFSQAYTEGNLEGMKAIFTTEARNSRGGLGAILANYGKLFQNSSDRLLVVRDVSWYTVGERATIIASYQATVTEGRGRRLRKTHGDLRLDLRLENQQWRIFRVLHDERSG